MKSLKEAQKAKQKKRWLVTYGPNRVGGKILGEIVESSSEDGAARIVTREYRQTHVERPLIHGVSRVSR